jgi:hypoxanthine phosphoribosyltransferase
MKEIDVLDRTFTEMITEEEIQQRVGELASRINRDYEGKEVLFLGILNGSFLFAAELFKKISLRARISFLKLASYEGTGTTGSVKQLIGLNEDLQGTEVVVIEDIVDTGNTLEMIVGELNRKNAAGVRIATLLLKPDSYTKTIPVDYVGFSIPNDFVVGYGLDYSGYGRNLPSLYTLVK